MLLRKRYKRRVSRLYVNAYELKVFSSAEIPFRKRYTNVELCHVADHD